MKNERAKARARARAKANYALQTGRIATSACEICGDAPAEMHHEDYDRPLEIRWLCHRHHQDLHRQERDRAKEQAMQGASTTHPFFTLISRANMKDSRVAASMAVTRYEFENVKAGRRAPSADFREAALHYLAACGMRNYDGAFYREDDLFLLEKSVA